MAIDPSTIGSVVSAAGSFFQPIVSLFQNSSNRRFANQQYAKQKRDAIDFWNMQNAYNTPAAQMQRFKEAGLNPNLMYGRGSEGNAGAINVPSQARWEGKAPDVASASSAPLDAILKYQNVRGQRLVNNNLGAQNDVLRADAELKRSQSAMNAIRTALSSFDYGLRRQAKNSLLLEMQSRGPRANALANLSTNQAAGSLLSNKLSEQQYRYLENMNPIQLSRAMEITKRLKEQGLLNEQRLNRMLKENRLIGFSGSSEIGGLARALITLFGVNF